MKHNLSILAAIASILLPDALQARESLFKAEAPTSVTTTTTTEESANVEPQRQHPKPKTSTPLIANRPPRRLANLSTVVTDDAIPPRSFSQVPEGNSTLRSSGVSDRLLEFKTGEAYEAFVPMSLMAFKGAKSPVVARVKLNGSVYQILGEASVEPNSKRIAVEFQKIRKTESDIVYEIQAHALSDNGTFGIVGEVHSGEGKFFLAEVLSAAAAGFVDASVNRTTNAFGNVQEERSVDTQSKKALSTAAMKTSERYAEKLKNAPEYVTVDGPLNIVVLVSTAPYRKL